MRVTDLQGIADYDAYLAAGGSISMLGGVAAADLDVLYRRASRDFSAGRIDAATQGFALVATLDAWHYEAWLSWGICQQHATAHREATLCFMKAGIVRPNEPMPPFLAAQSCRRLGQPDAARVALRAVLRLTDDAPHHATLRRQARDQLAALDGSESPGSFS